MFVDDAELKSDRVAEGDNIYFIGLLAQFYGTKRNTPVVRRGTLALMTDEDLQTETGPQKAFIAELQSWPGNSGSPVFLTLGGMRNGSMMLGEDFKFLGILLGDFMNKRLFDVAGQHAVINDASNIGISYVVPATKIKEILDSKEARSYRDAEIARLPKQP